jgi:hypothetical protein
MKDAEAGKEPENEDIESGKDRNVTLQGMLSLVPLPTLAPLATLLLVISDTVLGTFPITLVS